MCHEWEQEAEEGLLKHGAGEPHSLCTITQNKHVSRFMPVMLQAKANSTAGCLHQSLTARQPSILPCGLLFMYLAYSVHDCLFVMLMSFKEYHRALKLERVLVSESPLDLNTVFPVSLLKIRYE